MRPPVNSGDTRTNTFCAALLTCRSSRLMVKAFSIGEVISPIQNISMQLIALWPCLKHLQMRISRASTNYDGLV